jgi:hypothetical protein
MLYIVLYGRDMDHLSVCVCVCVCVFFSFWLINIGG